GSPDGPGGWGQMPDVLKRDPALSHVVSISQCPSSPHTALPEVLRLGGTSTPTHNNLLAQGQESQEEHGVPDTSPYLLVTRSALPLSRQLYNLGDFSSQVNSPEDQLRLRFRPAEPGQHQRRHCQGRKATEELPLAGLCAQVDLCPGCFRCTQQLDGKDLPPEQGLPLLQPGLGCRRHPNQRPFARSPEEALPRGLPGLLPQARSLPLSPFPREHQGRRKPHGLYCPACRATCGSGKAFENHCCPLEHTQMLALDMAVPWKHRSLPAGLSMLGLCPRPLKAYLCTSTSPWRIRPRRSKLSTPGPSLRPGLHAGEALLHARLPAQLRVGPETRRILEVQFQVDLLAFPPWHQAMDALPEEQLVLPNPLACALPSARSTRPARQQQAEAAGGGHHGDQPRGHAAHRPAASC
ncbi:hypothetical protein E2I00_016789, partial [Balaenoptera physalus]